MDKFSFFIGYLTFVLLIDLPVVAQTIPQRERIPQPILPSPESLPKIESLPPVEQLIPPLQLPDGESPTPEWEIPGTIVIRQFEVIGSTVFSQSELTELLKYYIVIPINFLMVVDHVRRCILRRGDSRITPT